MLGGFAGRRRLAELGRNPATRSLGSPRSLTTVGGCHPQAPHDYQLCEAPEARAVPYAVESLPVSRDPPSLPGRHDDGPLAGCPPKLDSGAGSRESPPAGAHGGCAPCRGKCGLWGPGSAPRAPPAPTELKALGYWGGSAHYPDPTAQSAPAPGAASRPTGSGPRPPVVLPTQERPSRPAGGSDPFPLPRRGPRWLVAPPSPLSCRKPSMRCARLGPTQTGPPSRDPLGGEVPSPHGCRPPTGPIPPPSGAP